MLIRSDIDSVFGAFVNPDITSNFWFTSGSAPLTEGSSVTWNWKMYEVSIPVEVIQLVSNSRIVIRWPGANATHQVEWTFEQRSPTSTFVTISETGFSGDGSSLLRQVADSTEGFALVLAGCKAWMEHGIRLGLVRDRFPDGIGGDDPV